MQRPLGAQISHMLKARGVEVIFGIPGVHNQELYRGIEEAGITHVLARHEQGAGFMADGYARASGRPGVAYVITGPGLCNAMTPMGQAYSDSVPMLVISSCLDEAAARRGQLHQMRDQRAAAETVCASSEEARSAGAAYALIDRALAEMALARPRPHHVQVPVSLLRAPTAPAGDAPTLGRPFRGGLDPRVFAPILAARRPLLVLGGGCVRAAEAVRVVLSRLGAASFETYAGRGVAGDHPLNFGSYLARAESARVIASADVVVLVGTEFAETDLWRDETGLSGHVIQVDIDPAGFHPEADVTVIARADEFLADLAEALEGHAAATGWDPAEVSAARERWRAQVDAEIPGVRPVAEALRACLPDDTMIFSDMTQFAYASLEYLPLSRPGYWHHPSGFGTLGYALPAAIGGCLARPGRPTLAIAGDYGFQFTLQELGTAVELGLPLPILLWDNGKLKAIEDSMVGAQIAPKAVVARNPDFAQLASAYGARTSTPGTLEEMQREVRAAFDAAGPTLIHVTPALRRT